MNDVLDRLREELGQSPRSGAAPPCLPDELIDAFALRSLPPEDLESAAAHLTTCLWCLRRYASARSLLETLEPDEGESPEPARARKAPVLREIERRSWLDRVRGLLVWRVPAGWALATAGLAVMALSYAIYQEMPFHPFLPPGLSDRPGSPVTELSRPSPAARRTDSGTVESQGARPRVAVPPSRAPEQPRPAGPPGLPAAEALNPAQHRAALPPEFLLFRGALPHADVPPEPREGQGSVLAAPSQPTAAAPRTLTPGSTKVKAGAEAAKADAAEAKADAEAARAKAAKAEAELMSRWNAVAAGVTTDLPNFGRVDFRWDRFDKFPHPTYKGGSAEAYGAFASLLVAFFQHGDNFDYLAANDLFTLELRHHLGFPLPPMTFTFAQLAAQMPQPGALGMSDENNRKALKFSDRIQALVKKQAEGKPQPPVVASAGPPSDRSILWTSRRRAQPHAEAPPGPHEGHRSPVTAQTQATAAAPRTLTGIVEKVEESVSDGVVSHVVTIKQLGGPTYVVFAWGPPSVRRGQSVRVSGVFTAVNPADPSHYAGIASQVSPMDDPR